MKNLLFILTLCLCVSCNDQKTALARQEQLNPSIPRGLIAEKAMVVSARVEASEIGIEIMKQGGNAFDAMVATHLALAVAYPVAGNIGGGGFMVYRMEDGRIGGIDFRETAPLAATKNMYLDAQGNVIKDLSTLGAMSVGVPGSIAGLFKIHEKFGTLPMSTLIQPAIDIATTGIIITKNQAKGLNEKQEDFRKANKGAIYFNKEWKAGDILKQPALAKTLARIRDKGKDGFYKGKTAEIMVNYLNNLRGIITLKDLEMYEAKWRDPITFTYHGNKIISMSPPSSGGICLAQILKSVEPYHPEQYAHNSEKYVQLIVEAERRAYADRAYYLGDPDFVKIPAEELMSPQYLDHRMADFNWDKATPSTSVGHGKIPGYESEETTHYSIVDPFGNAVSVTTTLNGGYGSKVYVEEAGFFLNNEMDDFSAKPGEPNMFGLIGAEANAIAPGKRMLSSMTPTIVEQNNALKMVVGTPGGSTIITSVAQNILNVLAFDMGMQESVNQPRFHHQWLPDEIKFEPSFNKEIFDPLKKLGYTINQSNSLIIGKVDAILVLSNGKLEAGADPRGDDAAAGY
ncbi:gamma-glutamyltransferase [Flavobacteriaceae bacterium F08102]|nr:gamma-glutamyltransferase [Flavobacteriaceae bacterium F08102]